MRASTRLAFAVSLVPLMGCLDVLGLGDYKEGGGGNASGGGGSKSSSGAQMTTSSASSMTTSSSMTSGSMSSGTESSSSGGVMCCDGPNCVAPGMTLACPDPANPMQPEVGNCHLGTKSCDVTGMFAQCKGFVSPMPENCAVFGNEACTSDIGCSDVLWHDTIGSTAYDYVDSIATDMEGHLYVAGELEGPTMLGTTTVSPSQVGDVYIVKYDVDGSYMGHIVFSLNSGFQKNIELASTNTSNRVLFVVHGTSGTVGPLNFSSRAIVYGALRDPVPAIGAVQKIDGDSGGVLAHIADTGAGMAMAGTFIGAITFPSGSVRNSAGMRDVFVAMFDGNGNDTHRSSYGDAGSQQVDAMTFDAGRVILGGDFNGGINFGGSGLLGPVAPSRAFFLAGLAPAATGGSFSHSFSTRYSGVGLGVQSLSSNTSGSGLLAAGTTVGSVTFNSMTQITKTTSDADAWFLEMEPTAAGPLRVTVLGSTGEELEARGVLGGSGPYFALSGRGTIGFSGLAPVASHGVDDVFLAQFDTSTGMFNWAKAIGGTGFERLSALALVGKNAVAVAGQSESAMVEFGDSMPDSTVGQGDAFVGVFSR